MTLNNLKNALITLQAGYKTNPSELERDGLIQRFEYCVELCWKTSKKILAEDGIQVDVPKNVFRELANIGWISNPKKWLEFIDKRNMTYSTYSEQNAIEVFDIIPSFIKESYQLLKSLESKLV